MNSVNFNLKSEKLFWCCGPRYFLIVLYLNDLRYFLSETRSYQRGSCLDFHSEKTFNMFDEVNYWILFRFRIAKYSSNVVQRNVFFCIKKMKVRQVYIKKWWSKTSHRQKRLMQRTVSTSKFTWLIDYEKDLSFESETRRLAIKSAKLVEKIVDIKTENTKISIIYLSLIVCFIFCLFPCKTFK